MDEFDLLHADRLARKKEAESIILLLSTKHVQECQNLP